MVVANGTGSASRPVEDCTLPYATPMSASELSATEKAPLPETATKGATVTAVVNLPEKEMETTLGFESALAPTSFGNSRDAAELVTQEQPKICPLLQVISLDSAEMLDVATAQPLLRCDQPDKPLPNPPAPPLGTGGTEMINQLQAGHYVALLITSPRWKKAEQGN